MTDTRKMQLALAVIVTGAMLLMSTQTGCRELGVCTTDEADRKDNGSMRRHLAECHLDDPGNWLVDGWDAKTIMATTLAGLLELRRREVKNGKGTRA